MKRNSKPNYIIEGIVEFCEPCNRSVNVAKRTDTAFETEFRVKIIVGDLKRSRGSITGKLGLREEENVRKESPQVLFHRRKVGVKSPNISEMNRERARSITRKVVMGGAYTATG